LNNTTGETKVKEEFFKESVEIENDVLRIMVFCKPRLSAFEPKRVYKGKVENLIPEDLKGKVRLVESPTTSVSNLRIPDHSSEGIWIYKIAETVASLQTKKVVSKNRRTRTSRTKK
jgi:hypothetical protein